MFEKSPGLLKLEYLGGFGYHKMLIENQTDKLLVSLGFAAILLMTGGVAAAAPYLIQPYTLGVAVFALLNINMLAQLVMDFRQYREALGQTKRAADVLLPVVKRDLEELDKAKEETKVEITAALVSKAKAYLAFFLGFWPEEKRKAYMKDPSVAQFKADIDTSQRFSVRVAQQLDSAVQTVESSMGWAARKLRIR